MIERPLGTLGLMMVRDEADVIEPVLRHLCEQVDAVWVFDNGSTDGTREQLDKMTLLGADLHDRVWVRDDPEVGYYQSQKMTGWAREATEEGWSWIVPCDADEIWYASNGMRVADFLASRGPDVQVVRATLWNQIPTSEDGDDPNPITRIQHRLPQPGAEPKVACRAHETLRIEMGNHGATYYDGVPVGTGDGLEIRHFTWRTPEQYLRKIRNGIEAYKATDLHSTFGAHWRMFDGAADEVILDHFRRWFVAHPSAVVHDPAPV